MADAFGLFWNSINSDRTYDADSFAEWLRKFFTTGVFNGEMQVTPGTGMNVRVAPGYANINGKVRFFDTTQTFTLRPANGTYPRIDTIVVRSDTTNRIITTEYVMGSYNGNSPVPTAPTRTGGIYELVLAQIRVDAGITSIETTDIIDTRSRDSLCGWVTSTVEGVPVDQIVAQMQADFGNWFDRMKGQLSEDAAGNLQLQIDDVKDVTDAIEPITYENQKYRYALWNYVGASIAQNPTLNGIDKGRVFFLEEYGRLWPYIALIDIPPRTQLENGVNIERYSGIAYEFWKLNNDLTTKRYIVSSEKINGYAYKWGKICMVTINDGVFDASPANTVLYTLPEGYRPIYQIEFVDSYGKARMRITTDGEVINVDAVTTYIRGTITYIVA